MKFKTSAIAIALSLSSSVAFAQAGGNDAGATVPERPATIASGDGAGARIVDPAGTIQNDRTTGLAPVVRPATAGVVPGARDKSRVGGEGVSDRPPGN